MSTPHLKREIYVHVIEMILNFKFTAENIVASSGRLAENTAATLYYKV